ALIGSFLDHMISASTSFLYSLCSTCFCFFFFNDPPPTEIYTLSLHDALPISSKPMPARLTKRRSSIVPTSIDRADPRMAARNARSEEHTSELQSLAYLVCRLLLEKKKKKKNQTTVYTTAELIAAPPPLRHNMF